MKLLKFIIILLCLGGAAALIVVYWPKIREYCDRCLARGELEEALPVDES